jgi:hypothetical protein
MTQLVTQNTEEQIERPDEAWKYPYVAAVVDFGTNLQVKVEKVNDAAVGYRITPLIYISHPDKLQLGFIDEFCENHGITPRLRETSTTFRLEIARRDDLRDFLWLVRPYLIARDQPVSILLDRLIPGLEDRKHSDKLGFVQLMHYVDKIREHTHGQGEPKYTEGYFRDEWNIG